jgi:hypothetical protein
MSEIYVSDNYSNFENQNNLIYYGKICFYLDGIIDILINKKIKNDI